MNYVSYVTLQARARPEATAVRDGTTTWTYAELVDDVSRAANVLAEQRVEKGDICLTLLPNSYDFVVATLATLAREGVVVPLNPDFRTRELQHILPRTEPAVVVGAPGCYDRARPHLPDDCTWLDGGVRGAEARASAVSEADSHDFSTAISEADSAYRLPKTLDSTDGFILYTSGTTGQPKGAVHSHGNFIGVSDACAISYELTPEDCFLAAMPMHHCTGMSILGTTLKFGGELFVTAEWDPEATLEAIGTHDITVFSGVPTMFQDWLSVADGTENTDSMHTAVIGGSDTTADLINRSEALLGCPVLNGYGMTETFIAGIWEDRDDDRRLPSVGRATDRLTEVQVVDPETGKEQPAGEAGELLIRGPTLMSRYHKEPEKTAEAFEDGWFHTGDMAEIDGDGYLYILGRMEYTIICGGHNIHPQEVEAAIERLDGVERAIVVGRDDERKGQKPIALVRRSSDAVTAEQIQDHCLEVLAPYKYPREVQFVDELPRNDVGKVNREALSKRI